VQVRDFVTMSKRAIADIKFLKQVMARGPLTRLVVSHTNTWSNLMLFLTMLINVFMVVTWEAPDGAFDEIGPKYRWEAAAPVFRVLAILHIVSTFLVLLSHFTVNPVDMPAWWSKRRPLGSSAVSKAAIDADAAGDVDGDGGPLGGDYEAAAAAVAAAAAAAGAGGLDATGQMPPPVGADNILRHLAENDLIPIDIYQTRNSVMGGESLYYYTLMAASVLGYVYHGYPFFFHLFFIVPGNDTLERVMQAITRNLKSLGYVAMLIVFVTYSYSLLSFAVMRDYFDKDEGTYCDTMFQCLVTNIRLSLVGERLSLLANSVNATDHKDMFAQVGLRTAFDLTFFILVTIIGLNVVFGIIVDTFSELRAEQAETREKMVGQCFICGIDSYEFDLHGNGFATHTKLEHRMWDYLFFFYHLDQKKATQFTFIEQAVATKLLGHRTDFVPLNMALELQGGDHAHRSGVAEPLAAVDGAAMEVARLRTEIARLRQHRGGQRGGRGRGRGGSSASASASGGDGGDSGNGNGNGNGDDEFGDDGFGEVFGNGGKDTGALSDPTMRR
jgi:hypothetical protein